MRGLTLFLALLSFAGCHVALGIDDIDRAAQGDQSDLEETLEPPTIDPPTDLPSQPGDGCEAALCPGIDRDCRTRTCDAGSCGYANTPAGVGCSDDDPQARLCDGEGNCVACNADSDCQNGACQGGRCVPNTCPRRRGRRRRERHRLRRPVRAVRIGARLLRR